jgi:hypothetical protein
MSSPAGAVQPDADSAVPARTEPAATPAATPAARPAAAPAITPAAAAPVPSPAPAAITHCDNCGAGISGRYCGNCGQRLEPPVHSLWHFLAVAMEDVTHADSRLWSTLWALIFKPGYLTHEFLAGRRARYLPPVRLYLVLSVMFFLLSALLHSKPEALQVSTNENGVPKAARVVPLKDTDLAAGPAQPGETEEQRATRECGMMGFGGSWGEKLRPAMQRACLNVRADHARSLIASMRHNLPRAMFVFLPLLAGLMMLMYWKPRHYYVEHLLLLVHNHAFVFLTVPLAWIVAALLPPLAIWVNLALFLYIVWYLYRSMRTVYGQGRWLTIGKFATLSFLYLVFGLVVFILNFAYSALTLD